MHAWVAVCMHLYMHWCIGECIGGGVYRCVPGCIDACGAFVGSCLGWMHGGVAAFLREWQCGLVRMYMCRYVAHMSVYMLFACVSM